MKTKHTIVIFLIGFALDILAGYFKLMQLQGAVEVLFAAVTLQLLGLILFIYKMLRNPKAREFLDA